MDFKNGAELLELCREHRCSISEIMRQREFDLGETTPDTLQTKMERILEIMRESASAPIKTPRKSIGGLIGGEARLLNEHRTSGKSICGNVISRAITYACAVLEVNTSMGLIVAAPTAGALTRANMAAASRAHASTVRVRRRRIKHFIQKSAPFSNRPFFHLYVKERERMPWRNLNAIFI